MCNPVAVGIASLAVSAVGTGVSIYQSDKQAEDAKKAQRESIVRQEKIVREATPSEAENITKNEKMIKELMRVRRGIAQNIYSNRNNLGNSMVGGKKSLLGV